MAKQHLHQQQRTRRAAMTVVAALCVLGFASLVFLHDASTPSMAASALPAAVGNLPAAGEAETSATSRFPSAASVFRGAPYEAPEGTIEQF
jgi:hypothetical protein